MGISFTGLGDGEHQGTGTQVYNNHVEVNANSTCYSSTLAGVKTKLTRLPVHGDRVCDGSDTNENRGYMQNGFGNNVTSNTGHIHRQQAVNSKYSTVDGEGVLQQEWTGNVCWYL